MNIHNHTLKLKSGHSISLFFNEDSGLFVADVVHRNQWGGNEFVRMTINPNKMVAFAAQLPEQEEDSVN